MSVRSAIMDEFDQVAKQQNMRLAPLTDALALLDSGLDSLCLAVVVARLEDELGVDPFSAAVAEAQLPVTVGEFIQLYEDAIGQQKM
jgi:acyl carrier protein